VAYSKEEYKDKVRDLCHNREKLHYYKSGFIREEFDKCMDADNFMVGYENGLLQIYLDAIRVQKNAA
jgi:hypothetical protein